MQLPSCMGILGKTVCVEPSYSACTPESSSSFQPISPWLNPSPTDAHDTPGILHEMDCRYPDFSMFVARRDSDMFADLCVTKTELRAARDIIKNWKRPIRASPKQTRPEVPIPKLGDGLNSPKLPHIGGQDGAL